MKTSPLMALIVCVLSATPMTLSATPTVPDARLPSMPDQVPELMHRSILPVTRDVPTCVAIADRPVGESDYLVVGLANGTVNIFHPSGSDMIVRVVDLDRERPVDDVCAVRMAGARTDFAMLALQGRTLSAMGEEVSRIKGSVTLPSPTGVYALVRVPAESDAGSDPVGGRVLVHDDRSVYEVRLGATGQRWEMTLEPVLSDPAGLAAHALSDRVVFVLGTGGVREFTVAGGLLDPASSAIVRPMVVPGTLSTDGDRLNILSRKSDGGWSTHEVELEDSLTLTATLNDSLLLLGGALTRDELRRAGWLTLVDARGRTVARGEHGRPVAAAAAVGEWVAVQGEHRNLSLYDMDLAPIWEHASQVAPLALLAADLNMDDSEDLVVAGMRQFRVQAERVSAIREVLGRPGFMREATARGRGMYLDRPMLTVYYSRAGELEQMVRDGRRSAEELRRSRDYTEAARHLLTARAAAAALGHRDDTESLREEGARLFGMPKRTRAALLAAALLLVAGLVSVILAPRLAARGPGHADTWIALVLVCAGLTAWWLLGRVAWSPALMAGGIIAGVGATVARLRHSAGRPARRAAGAPIEELELRIKEFTHGGDGSSDQGRKKLTTLAYLIQEMLDSTDDPKRCRMLGERLALRYKSFYPAKYQLAIDLPRHAREAGVAIKEAEAISRAATDLHAAMVVCLDSSAGGCGPDTEEGAVALADALAARETLRDAADAAELIVRRNPGCSVIACIERVLDERQEVLDATGVEIVKDLGLESSEDAVAIHRTSLQFIIENLVTNALRAMGESGVRRISFVGRVTPTAYELHVSDTGCGITADALREIFIPREMDSVTGGLGLPHSRELLRRIGGNIVVEQTEVGAGTTMLVTLRFWEPERPTA